MWWLLLKNYYYYWLFVDNNCIININILIIKLSIAAITSTTNNNNNNNNNNPFQKNKNQNQNQNHHQQQQQLYRNCGHWRRNWDENKTETTQTEMKPAINCYTTTDGSTMMKIEVDFGNDWCFAAMAFGWM